MQTRWAARTVRPETGRTHPPARRPAAPRPATEPVLRAPRAPARPERARAVLPPAAAAQVRTVQAAPAAPAGDNRIESGAAQRRVFNPIHRVKYPLTEAAYAGPMQG